MCNPKIRSGDEEKEEDIEEEFGGQVLGERKRRKQNNATLGSNKSRKFSNFDT